jgi:hypothetical protein
MDEHAAAASAAAAAAATDGARCSTRPQRPSNGYGLRRANLKTAAGIAAGCESGTTSATALQ